MVKEPCRHLLQGRERSSGWSRKQDPATPPRSETETAPGAVAGATAGAGKHGQESKQGRNSLETERNHTTVISTA